MNHTDNAIAYYHHLIEQGLRHGDAVSHVMQRFGIDRDVLRARLGGGVAHAAATRRALADARALLLHEEGSSPLHRVALQNLYEAITGEEL